MTASAVYVLKFSLIHFVVMMNGANGLHLDTGDRFDTIQACAHAADAALRANPPTYAADNTLNSYSAFGCVPQLVMQIVRRP